MWWIIVIVVIVLIIFAAGKSEQKMKNELSGWLSARGITEKEFISDAGQYIFGHPEIDKQHFKKTTLALQEGNIVIYQNLSDTTFALSSSGKIENVRESVKNIEVEDSSTIERRATFGRMLAVGVFAFAWKKKKVNELAFVTIEYNDGKFKHEVTFKVEGKDSLNKANSIRNKLITWCK